MNKELAKTLTTALVQWIDKVRPEGTMCCSNAECESIEQMLEGEHFDIVENFIQKKLTGMTEFEQGVRDMIINTLTTVHTSSNGQITSTVAMDKNTTHLLAAGLLKLAKKELLKEWNENMKDEYARGKRDGLTIGYNNGYKDAEKRYNESVTYHYDVRPLCWEPGGTCTNPHMDCINCPRKTTGGFNTQSGTSTLKAEE